MNETENKEIAGEAGTSLVVETYNYREGTSLESLRNALRVATSLPAPADGMEVLLADVTQEPKIAAVLEDEFPSVRRIDGAGLGYDEAKALAAREARGRYIVYLDCDCIPEPGWFEKLLAPLVEGRAVASGGFAYYPGGFFTSLYSMMDFGFLIPHRERHLGCYASNNSAFVRQVLLDIPEPAGPMRCRCYAHAQELARRGKPVLLAAGARVRHEPPPFLRERLRQGYDMVAACWVDPRLPEARLLSYRVAAAPLFYLKRVRLDWRTLRKHADELGFGVAGRAIAYPMVALLRLIDFIGMLAALAMGTSARRLVDPPPKTSNYSEPESQSLVGVRP